MSDISSWTFSVEDKARFSGVSEEGVRVCHLRSPAFWLAKHVGERLPDRLADLVEIAYILHAADRLAVRDSNWRRHLVVHAPVRDSLFWGQEEVQEALHDALSYVTDDHWEVRCTEGQLSNDRAHLQRFLPEQEPLAACLFSGGLDSLAGLAADLAEEKFKTILPVCCTASTRLKSKQKEILTELGCSGSARLRPVMLTVSIWQPKEQYNFNERSQRTRGFLFGSLGAAVAVMAGSGVLRIYENGVGAINLPLTAAQIGTQSTRSTHPLALYKLEKLLRLVLEQDFVVELPFAFSTKGEICARLAGTKWRSLVARSVSCDGFPRRHSGPVHCGVCTSCLLRRQACWVADIGEDRLPQEYWNNVLEESCEADIRPLADMVAQAQRISWAVSQPHPLTALFTEFPEILDAVEAYRLRGEENAEARLVDLYSRYALEWNQFPARPHGWRMAA